jgi:hypothetical protein
MWVFYEVKNKVREC